MTIGTASAARSLRQQRLTDTADQEREQHRREGELHVGDAHQNVVDKAAEIAAEQSGRGADCRRDHDREQPDDERDPDAIEDQRGEIGALAVGAEKKTRITARHEGWGQKAVEEVEGGEVVGVGLRQPGSEERGEYDQRENERGECGHGRGQEPSDGAGSPQGAARRRGRSQAPAHAPARSVTDLILRRGSAAA